jgi:hypothetical protein
MYRRGNVNAPIDFAHRRTPDRSRPRGFNRLYTRIIGTLREGLLNSEYSLSEARVLYELATRQESTAREIARDPAAKAAELRPEILWLARRMEAAMRKAVAARLTTFRVRFFRIFPPLNSLEGHSPSQEAKWCSLGRGAQYLDPEKHLLPYWGEQQFGKEK